MGVIWRIPSDDDFKYLEGYVDSTYDVGASEWNGFFWRGDDVGDNLKAASADWDNATPGYRCLWNALPGGFLNPEGSLFQVGARGFWWTTGTYFSNPLYRTLHSTYSESRRYYDDHEYGFSVRCLRDTTTAEESDDDGTIYTDNYQGNDGTKYDAVKLGNQVWITENLKETKWFDGASINEETTAAGWEDAGTNSDPALMGSTDHPDPYGYLYNCYVVDSSKNLINYDYVYSAETPTVDYARLLNLINRPGSDFTYADYKRLYAEDIIFIASELQRKRQTSSAESVSTLSPDLSNAVKYYLSALAVNLTIDNPIGAPVLGENIFITLVDDGTSRSLSFGTEYVGLGSALPTATTVNKIMQLSCTFDGSNWLCVSYIEP